MSLRGRYVIDRIKQVIGTKHFKLPVPPYGEAEYWNKSYQSLGPQDALEWGDVSLQDIMTYEHRRLDQYYSNQKGSFRDETKTTTFAETIGIAPHAEQDEPILMLGCGNSRMGEQMIEQGWRGPVIQVDVSDRVIESMSQRCHELIQKGNMNFIQDDATELSAFRNGMIQSCLDKGLIDALFCADEYEQCHQVLKSVHRVLKPKGTFLIWSFSRPEFLLPQILVDPSTSSARARQTKTVWEEIQIHELSNILLYKFQKKEAREDSLKRLSIRRR